MKDKVPKTNAMRILENNGVNYEVVTYQVDLEHLDAVHAAQSANLPIEQVFKTIVMVTQDKRYFVFCVPGAEEINPKKARALTDSKEIGLVKLEDLQKLTGYVRGGCSPLGMIKQFPTFIEETAQLYDEIYVSAGLRGVQLKLNPLDLCKCCNGSFEAIILES